METLFTNLKRSTTFYNMNIPLMQHELSKMRGRILDVGCGQFPSIIGFQPGEQYVGVDISKSPYTNVVCDALYLPFKTEIFDGVICNAVLEHSDQPTGILFEINRVLRILGELWVSVPFMQHIHAPYGDFQRWTHTGLAKICTETGFKVHRTFGFPGVAITIEYLAMKGIGYAGLRKKKNWGYIMAMTFLYIFAKVIARLFSKVEQKEKRFSIAFIARCKKIQNLKLK